MRDNESILMLKGEYTLSLLPSLKRSGGVLALKEWHCRAITENLARVIT